MRNIVCEMNCFNVAAEENFLGALWAPKIES